MNYNTLAGKDCSCFPLVKRSIGPGFFIGDMVMLLMAALAGWANVPLAARVSGETIPFRIIATTTSTCRSRGDERIVSSAGSARMSTPGSRPAATATHPDAGARAAERCRQL